MKILHTSDLHIGKRLYEYDLIEDHRLFFNWMIQTIGERKIDYLLITGDIFDQSNPSQDSLKLYYTFLAELSKTGCQAIITAGNHDSPALIDAPEDILSALNIRVIGTVPENVEELMIPIQDSTGKIAAVIAAIPFLRDRDIRKAAEAESYDSRLEAVRDGITRFYGALADRMNEKYPDIPKIVTGHLYVQGAQLSGSEREIQIGNLAGIEENAFSEGIHHFALGHLHKAQDVDTAKRIRYCGTPLPLSFAEREYQHKVILLTIDSGEIRQEDIRVPQFRMLVDIRGTGAEVAKQLSEIENPCDLPVLADIYITEDCFTPEAMQHKESLGSLYNNASDVTIVQSRIKFMNITPTAGNPSDHQEDFNELTPDKVFEEIIKPYSEEEKIALNEIFLEIKQSAEERGKS